MAQRMLAEAVVRSGLIQNWHVSQDGRAQGGGTDTD